MWYSFETMFSQCGGYKENNLKDVPGCTSADEGCCVSALISVSGGWELIIKVHVVFYTPILCWTLPQMLLVLHMQRLRD